MSQSEPVTQTRSSFARRALGAAIFRIDVYEEVEHDRTATTQAAIVVGIVAIAAAIGGLSFGASGPSR